DSNKPTETSSKRSRAARFARRRRASPGLPLALPAGGPGSHDERRHLIFRATPAVATHHEPTPSRPVDHLTPRRPPQGRLRRRYAMSYRSPLTRPPRSTASARTKGDGRMLVANPVLLKETVDLDRCTMGEHHRHPID